MLSLVVAQMKSRYQRTLSTVQLQRRERKVQFVQLIIEIEANG